MGFLKGLFEGVVGLAAEMTMQKTPYDKRRKPTKPEIVSKRVEWDRDMRGRIIPGNCREVITVRGNVRTISRFTEGTTPQGNRSEVHTRIGRDLWEISTEKWDTEIDPEYQSRIDNERW